MRKIIAASIILLVAQMSLFPAMAATTDFTASGNITVSGVTFGQSTADMLIFDASTSESWSYNSGVFTVTNPGAAFKVGSSDVNVGAIQVILDGSSLSCNANTTPGTTYVTLPTAAGTYSIVPHATTACTSGCTAIAHALTYNTYPTCGAASCEGGYDISGTDSSATCRLRSVQVTSPGGGGSSGANTQPLSEIKPAEPEKKENEIITQPAEQIARPQDVITQIKTEATNLISNPLETLISTLGMTRNLAQEQKVNEILLKPLLKKVKTSSQEGQTAAINFVTYGTQSTRSLGEGERAGVLNSYHKAYERLPEKSEDWQDAIKIANGRFPGQQSVEQEKAALKVFGKIYKRMPDYKNTHDEAALKIIAYGIRPTARNTESEKAAIKSFKGIYGKSPSSTEDWDITRAIAYSGAKR